MSLTTALLFLISIFGVVYAAIEYFNDRQKTKPFVFFAVGFAGLLIAIYRLSGYIDPQHLGDHDKFGQFGDYIGGVLNPIFGFMTVFLLIRTLSHESEQAKQDRIDTQESSHQKKLERVSQALAKAESTLFDQITKTENFGHLDEINAQRKSFNDYFLAEPDLILRRHRTNKLQEITTAIFEHRASKSFFDTTKFSDQIGVPEFYINEIAAIRQDIQTVALFHLLLIKNETCGIIKYQRCNEYINFTLRIGYYNLISTLEVNLAVTNAEQTKATIDGSEL